MALILRPMKMDNNTFKVLIAAEYSGVVLLQVDVSSCPLETNLISEDSVLETPDGPIYGSITIARYVTRWMPDNPLYGSCLYESGIIDERISFSSFVLANVKACLQPRNGCVLFYSAVEANALKSALVGLNQFLYSNTYLVGRSVTLADIVLICDLYLVFTKLMPKSITSEFSHVERYFWMLVNEPNFKKILGEVKQCESPQSANIFQTFCRTIAAPFRYSPPPLTEWHLPAQPKEAAKSKPKDEPKNPLDLLPPSKMILDDWKRLYSNTKTNFRDVAIREFWDMYDPEGYSLWFCDYKYNDENTDSFVTLNKVSGLLQGMDPARKYAFGKMLVIGAEPPFEVKGLWLFRGQEIPQFVLNECSDMELYDWKKVDIADEDQKERVIQMIEDYEPFEGEALLDAKCFK